MRIILILCPYIIIPLLVTLGFKKLKSNWTALTYLLTGIIIFFYPFGLFWLDDYLNPPPPGPRCGNPQMGFVLANLIILLPISMIIQYVFNKIMIKKTNSESKIELDKNKSEQNRKNAT